MPKLPDGGITAYQRALLAWYDGHARILPWRAAPNTASAPAYHVWLSEVMLQQTTVATVKGYFADFITRWPRIEDLAAAPLEAVLSAWAGLGYYARARNLHACAQLVTRDFGGQFPRDFAALRALPGIGDYTAAAIRAIAFDQPAVVIDGNIERVMSRLGQLETPLPQGKAALRTFAEQLSPQTRPGDYAQALMDLGASHCSPKKPACLLCPISAFCQSYENGGVELAATLPRKLPKAEKPQREAAVFWITDPGGRVFLRRRPAKGLLGGMLEFPSSPWVAQADFCLKAAKAHAPLGLAWHPRPDFLKRGPIKHTFTHFHLTLHPLAAQLDQPHLLDNQPDRQWVAPQDLAGLGLPTLMRKVVPSDGL